jgi:hypothetical protein
MKSEEVSKRTTGSADSFALAVDCEHGEVFNSPLHVSAKSRTRAFDRRIIVAGQLTWKLLLTPLNAIVLLGGCGALDPVCRNARPKPVLTSLARQRDPY